MGTAARMMAIDKFSEQRILKAFAEFYDGMFSTLQAL